METLWNSYQVIVPYTARGLCKHWRDSTAEKGEGESRDGRQLPELCICRENWLKCAGLLISFSAKKRFAHITWVSLLWLIPIFLSSVIMRCILTNKTHKVGTWWWSSGTPRLQVARFSPGLSFPGRASVKPCTRCTRSARGWKPWPWSPRLTWRAMTTFQCLNSISSHDCFRWELRNANHSEWILVPQVRLFSQAEPYFAH